MTNNRTMSRYRIVQSRKTDPQNCHEIFNNMPAMNVVHAELVCDRMNAMTDKYTPASDIRWIVVVEGYKLKSPASCAACNPRPVADKPCTRCGGELWVGDSLCEHCKLTGTEPKP